LHSIYPITALLKRHEWVQAIAALLMLFVVFWQSVQTKHAAQAAKEAAISAKEQAKYSIASERPWMLIEMELVHNGGYPVIACRTVNHGKTPAEIVDTFAKFSMTSLEENLPDEPEHEYKKDRGLPCETPHHPWIAPSKSLDIFKYDTSELDAVVPGQWKAILDGKVHLYFLGYIRYRDTLSTDLHESRFCYRYGYSPDVVLGLHMSGPAGYNEPT